MAGREAWGPGSGQAAQQRVAGRRAAQQQAQQQAGRRPAAARAGTHHEAAADPQRVRQAPDCLAHHLQAGRRGAKGQARRWRMCAGWQQPQLAVQGKTWDGTGHAASCSQAASRFHAGHTGPGRQVGGRQQAGGRQAGTARTSVQSEQRREAGSRRATARQAAQQAVENAARRQGGAAGRACGQGHLRVAGDAHDTCLPHVKLGLVHGRHLRGTGGYARR